ncbi:MAG: VOC family protein [Thermoplasmata archaeon]|nr:VOC family protein [Thermoplasmata archaeon]
MPEAWLSDVGLRVTDLEKSIEFYTRILDLEELKRGGDEDGRYVLFRDRRSRQRLELNWYPESSPFWSPYVPGDGLDHIEVRVKSVPETLATLAPFGIRPVNRELWVNAVAVGRLRADPVAAAQIEQEVWVTKTGHNVAYIPDPDGNLLALYDHPEERWDGPIPDHY